MKNIIKLLILSAAVALTACTYRSEPYTGRDKHYLAATSVEPLKIPPGISSRAFHNEYPVSEHYYPERVKEVSLVPPGLYTY